MTSYMSDIPMRHVARHIDASGFLIAEITEANLALIEECSTKPTKPSVGQVWKRAWGDGWILGHCYAHRGKRCLIEWRRLVVVDAASFEKST